MSSNKLDNSTISKHLGQVSEYKDQYDPKLLVKEPRANNRVHLDIKDDELPFVGFDVWNAYEVSGLTYNGLPVSGVAKIVYPCTSKFIVESKSIKLYFNSFNMYKCGTNATDVLMVIASTATRDLSILLGCRVSVGIKPSGYEATGAPIFTGKRYHTLENMLTKGEELNMQVEQYVETPDLLLPGKFTTGEPTIDRYHTSLLKSNCRVTSQPDWGDVYIMMRGNQHIAPMSLLKYLISFRDECHFHEEICETIYKRIHDVFEPLELVVTCLYARRGGIDINPCRASARRLISKKLLDHHIMHVKTDKQ